LAPESEGDVLEGREVRKEQVVLKDDADRPFLRRDMDVVERVLEHDTVEGDPPGTDLDQAADGTKERRFSRPIGTNDCHDLTIGNSQLGVQGEGAQADLNGGFETHDPPRKVTDSTEAWSAGWSRVVVIV